MKLSGRKILMKSLNYCYVVAACVGLLYQVYDYSSKYFEYQVSSKTSLIIPRNLSFMALDLCARYSDFTESKSKLRISDIFNQTPPTDDIIHSCHIRQNNSYGTSLLDAAECNEIFNVSKFLIGEFMCYRFQAKNREQEFEGIHVSYSIRYVREFYDIKLNPKSQINQAYLVKMTLSRAIGQGVPYVSNLFSRAFVTGYDKLSNKLDINYMKLGFKFTGTRNLEPPYVTNCLDYGEKSLEECLFNCIADRVVNQTGLFPFTTGTFDQNLDIYLLDENNLTSNKILDDAKKYCGDNLCSRTDCWATSVATYPFLNRRSDFDSLIIMMTAPLEPDTFVQVQPAMYFPEFLILVTSCVGTWIGVSILSINPFKIKSDKKTKKCKCNKITGMNIALKKLDRRTLYILQQLSK